MRLLYFTFFILITSICNAQIKEIGIKSGFTNTLIRINNLKTTRGQSFYTHAFAQVYKYNNFSIQTGLGIIEKNSISHYKKSIGNGDSAKFTEGLETRSFFAEVDTKYKLQIPELKNIYPYILIGCQYAVLNKQNNNITMELNKTQIQGMLGLGFDFDLNSTHVFFEYNKLLNFNSNYSKTSGLVYLENTGIYMLGLKLPLIGKKS